MSGCEDHTGVGSLMPPQTQGELTNGHQREDSSASNLHKELEKWSKVGPIKP